MGCTQRECLTCQWGKSGKGYYQEKTCICYANAGICSWLRYNNPTPFCSAFDRGVLGCFSPRLTP